MHHNISRPDLDSSRHRFVWMCIFLAPSLFFISLCTVHMPEVDGCNNTPSGDHIIMPKQSSPHFGRMAKSKAGFISRRNRAFLMCSLLGIFNMVALWYNIMSMPVESSVQTYLPVPLYPSKKLIHSSSVIKKPRAKIPNGWWSPWVNGTSTTYQKWEGTHTDWCHPVSVTYQRKQPSMSEKVQGLCYIKSYKASSSTLAGVNAAIAHRLGSRMFPGNETYWNKCEHYNDHLLHDEKKHVVRRDPEHSIMWSFVRYPQDRDLSWLYHFAVSRRRHDPNTEMEYLIGELKSHTSTQLVYLLQEYEDVHELGQILGKHFRLSQKVANFLRTNLLEKYDFLGVTERMHESLAVMVLLWDLEPGDVISLSSKIANGVNYDAGGYKNRCTKMIAPPRSFDEMEPLLASYLNSTAAKRHHMDYLLYYAVNESLDRTIEALGKHRVMQTMKEIQDMQALAEKKCRGLAIFPCSKEGEKQEGSKKSCYYKDEGCGHPCIDEFVANYRDKKWQGFRRRQ